MAFASFPAMHSVFEMVITGISEERAKAVTRTVCSMVSEIEKKLDRHNPDSFFARLDSSSGDGSAIVDEEVFSVLQFCEVFRENTSGYFDIAALSRNAVRPAYSLCPSDRSVTLSGKGIFLDAGGFGKGYALDRVRHMLISEGITDALLNFGDSSVLALGRHPFGDCWQVEPKTGGHIFRLRDSALSLSGPKPDGSAHIVNPADGSLVQSQELAAVEGRSAFVCEVLSTALYAAPGNMRAAILASFEGYSHTAIKLDLKKWIEENL